MRPTKHDALSLPRPDRGDLSKPLPCRADHELTPPVPVAGDGLQPPLPAWKLQELTLPNP
jgi:hypothetical protein